MIFRILDYLKDRGLSQSQMGMILVGPARVPKLASTKVPRFLLDVVSRASPEAACGAEPKASTERVRMAGVAAPLTPQEALSLSQGVGQGLRPPCLPRSQSGKLGHGMQPKGLPKRSAELQDGCSNIPITWVSDWSKRLLRCVTGENLG
jgi:hypothetical protein